MPKFGVSFNKPVDERYVKPARRSLALQTSKVAHQALNNAVRERIDVSEKLIMEYNSRIILPQLSLIKVPGTPYSIMAKEVTIGLYDLCMNTPRSMIEGSNPALLSSSLHDPWNANNKTSLDLHESRMFVRELNRLTGRKFVIPTEAEWIKAYRAFGDDLSGDNWEWTDTKMRGSRSHVLRSLSFTDREEESPEAHYDCIGLRLVEYEYFKPLSSLLRLCVNFRAFLKFSGGTPEKI